MTETGLEAFDTTVQKTNTWLSQISGKMGWDDRHRSYLALRGVLHALRDRLTVEEAADLGAQLPMLVRGIYYDGWRPAEAPQKYDRGGFLARVNSQFDREPGIDPEPVARAVFSTLSDNIAQGEIADIKDNLPKDLVDLVA